MKAKDYIRNGWAVYNIGIFNCTEVHLYGAVGST